MRACQTATAIHQLTGPNAYEEIWLSDYALPIPQRRHNIGLNLLQDVRHAETYERFVATPSRQSSVGV
jgi:hypothetical protein